MDRSAGDRVCKVHSWIPSIFLSKIETESSDESKSERGVEGEEKRDVQHDHPAERRNRLGI